MRDEIKIPTMKITPLKKICMTIGELPTSYLETMTYYEMLVWFTNYLRDSIIPAVNNNAEAVHELQQLFVELQTYVNNYFDNLDVQEEINNKLDNLAESGQLAEIIAQYTKLNAINIYNTVNEMINSNNLADGSTAQTLGYYEIGDGGGAIYKINTTDTPNGKNIISLNNNLIASLVITDIINVKQFGAKGDGINDDTSYIQTAINNLKDNTSLYFPKGENSNYLISDELILSANDINVYSDTKTEYSTSITCNTANKTIMLITGYGVTFKNLSFIGNGTEENFSSVNGLTFDRTSLGDNETYSNIDCVVEDCLFLHLNNCLTVKGRNARIKNNTFTESKNGIIGLLHKYNSDTQISEFRGFYIVENVFHSMNFQTNALVGSTLETLNSVCIKMPIESDKLGNIQILNNKSEYCKSIFYKGYLPCAQISNNQLYFSLPTLIYSPNNDNSLQSRSNGFMSQINDNIVRGIANNDFTDTFIYVKNTNNVNISNNNFRQCNGNGIINDSCGRMKISNNFIQAYGTTENSGILFENVGNGVINNNVINSFINSNYGITSSNNVEMSNNTISGTTKQINVLPQFIVNSIIKTRYIKPDTQNNFNYYDPYTLGITKYDNGMKELFIALNNGTDNGVALTLPVGYRPSNSFIIPAIVMGPETTVRAYAFIGSNGEIKINWSGTPDSNTVYIIKTIFL